MVYVIWVWLSRLLEDGDSLRLFSWLGLLVVAPPPRWFHFHCNIKCFGGISFQLVVDIMVVELLGLR